jgi:hypothetical protein
MYWQMVGLKVQNTDLTFFNNAALYWAIFLHGHKHSLSSRIQSTR